MHDSLRHFCIKKAEEEKFFHVMIDDICDLNPNEVLYFHRLILPSKDHKGYTAMFQGLPDVTHSLLLYGIPGLVYPAFYFIYTSRLKLLKVLVLSIVIPFEFSEIAENLINLKCLATSIHGSELLPSISRFCNLQTLIYGNRAYLCKGRVQKLFRSTHLRHVELNGNGFLFVDCSVGKGIALQENLHMLFSVAINKGFPEMLRAIPNIKNLGICSLDTESYSYPVDLRCLIKLEVLKCMYDQHVQLCTKAPSVLPYLIFPVFLKKLSLRNYRIPLYCMANIGSLPSLRVLTLQRCEFETLALEPNEGEFSQLQCLIFQEVDLEKWIVSEVNFPRLEHLVIRGCIKLEAVPRGIGDIPTLGKIEVLGKSNNSVLKFVREIQDEQIEFGNDTLQICIDTSTKFSSHVF